MKPRWNWDLQTRAGTDSRPHRKSQGERDEGQSCPGPIPCEARELSTRFQAIGTQVEGSVLPSPTVGRYSRGYVLLESIL